MMIKKSKIIKYSLLSVGSLFLLTSCKFASNNKKKSGVNVSTVAEFKQAIASGSKSILTGDIDFNHEAIILNHDVSINSLNDDAELKNVYFTLSGPTVVGEKIDVSFSNIVFDGTFDGSTVDLTNPTNFIDQFGSDREEKRCLTGNNGYFSLNLDNCVIKNYASEVGPAIYVGNNANRDDTKVVNISNCKFYNNYSAYDTLQLSNEKLDATITESEFYSNYAYKAAGFSITNGVAKIDKVNIHDNIFVPYEDYIPNFQNAGGGVFLGGLDLKMSNSYIVNNKTTYGGGLAVSTSYSGNKSIIFDNVTIKNNQATYGGGIVVFSLFGQPATFVDCEILNNKAETGSALFTEVYAKWVKANNGGIVQFFFTTFGLNSANDNNTFKFYNADKTKGELGTISLKGCFAIGNDTYESDAEDYNYIATKEQALLDGVLSENTLSDIENGLTPIKGSKADIKVKAETYTKWSSIFENDKKVRKIGKYSGKTGDFSVKLTVIIVGSILVVASLTVSILLALRKKKSKKVVTEQGSIEEDKREEYFSTLSDREKQVVRLMIALKKRKEIADELNYSENTIKKDLTSIYSKLHVLDKYELMSKYKDLIKK